MPYRFAHDRPDYTDFAAGPVLYSLPGQPAFPVRLTTEIFQRCQAHLQRLGRFPPYAVYDPCCGSAYLLTTLGYLHWPAIRQLVGSDVSQEVIGLAERNLSLLTLAGVDARIAQLAGRHEQYGKPSHAEAQASAERLRARLLAYRELHPIRSRFFAADALDGATLRSHFGDEAVDIVITDLPYGQRTAWQGDSDQAAPGPEWQFLEALREIVTPLSIIAVTATKRQKLAHEAYERVEQFQIGKRRTLFFRLKEG
jgi:23S rRNA (guanine2535-N1)-methyltransferase